jgi:hypothetical protein
MQHVCRVTITGELKSYTPAIKDLIPVLNIANNSGCGQASRVFTRSPRTTGTPNSEIQRVEPLTETPFTRCLIQKAFINGKKPGSSSPTWCTSGRQTFVDIDLVVQGIRSRTSSHPTRKLPGRGEIQAKQCHAVSQRLGCLVGSRPPGGAARINRISF